MVGLDNLGLMPYRRRIVAVSKWYTPTSRLDVHPHRFEVGNPIHVVQTDKPTLEEIMHVQQQYIDELMRYVLASFGRPFCHCPRVAHSICFRIWHTYKDQFAKTRTRELSIVE